MTDPVAAPVKVYPPLARQVVRAAAIDHGVCVRPLPLRRTDLETGKTEIRYIPCGNTLASVCPTCAERKRQLRAVQCRQGWHLEEEPTITRADPDENQTLWVQLRAEAQAKRDAAERDGGDLALWDDVLLALDEELERLGARGSLKTGDQAERRTRSTRRRQDAPDLPRRPVSSRTVGKVYTAPDGKTFRPSLFLTLTLDSYGRVHKDGTPVDPASYDYRRAARDALHFSKLIDRFVQNLRRFVGHDVQYFAAVEPQRRLAPHVHMAVRGTISRAELRQVAAATYHQVWWPSVDEIRYPDPSGLVWDEETGNYVDVGTGEILPTWDQALDALGEDEDAEPLHVVTFGRQFDAQGVMAGSADSARCIGYLTKYLTKGVAECHEPDSERERAHVDRLTDALRYEPCAPTCANWLRYGVQPKNPKRGLTPGFCRGKAHRRAHLGYGGRRVLVSRKWSGKTLADHKQDRRDWVLARLAEAGIPTPAPDETGRYMWAFARPGDPDVKPPDHRLLLLIDERIRQQIQIRRAQELSATGADEGTVLSLRGAA
ncbi:replication initiation protein [Actinocorallia sp. API 0066]|uniref:replication initiator n=1 Tax=Actinocorallia sp. API 0066 TaxID=2896846 RepID=UPI001E60EB8C|nr:replication initiator [Actinocorallia sp. API 0066]MCD0451949.1 replication initiation protein [Actinocorallia sp. API 0066]